MTKYHIKKDGTPGKCNAREGNCPFGGAEQHFDTSEEAQRQADEFNLKREILSKVANHKEKSIKFLSVQYSKEALNKASIDVSSLKEQGISTENIQNIIFSSKNKLTLSDFKKENISSKIILQSMKKEDIDKINAELKENGSNYSLEDQLYMKLDCGGFSPYSPADSKSVILNKTLSNAIDEKISLKIRESCLKKQGYKKAYFMGGEVFVDDGSVKETKENENKIINKKRLPISSRDKIMLDGEPITINYQTSDKDNAYATISLKDQRPQDISPKELENFITRFKPIKRYDYDVYQINGDYMNIYKKEDGSFYGIGNKTNKEFKTEEDFQKYLKKNNGKFIGEDKQWIEL